jgi:hypothetical protein
MILVDRIPSYGHADSGKLQGYGIILIKGNALGGYTLLDKNNGYEIAKIPTIGGTWALYQLNQHKRNKYNFT